MPAQQQTGNPWYTGTADALHQNLDMLREAGAQYLLVLAGDHAYKMDYSLMLAEHVLGGADARAARRGAGQHGGVGVQRGLPVR